MLLGKLLCLKLVMLIVVVGWVGVVWFGIVDFDYCLCVLWGLLVIVGNVLLNIDVLCSGCCDSGMCVCCVLLWVYLLVMVLVVWCNGVLWLSGNLLD